MRKKDGDNDVKNVFEHSAVESTLAGINTHINTFPRRKNQDHYRPGGDGLQGGLHGVREFFFSLSRKQDKQRDWLIIV